MMPTVDKLRFKQACKSIMPLERPRGSSIGTMGEKTLHAVLKHYYEPDASKHEMEVGGFVADIATDIGIIEIQTRAFDRLRKKLAEFLKTSPVTVVYPIPRTKWLLWIDEQTGEVTKKRKSPKQGKIYDIVPELYKIKPLLTRYNLRLCIVLIDMEEYRYLNGWSRDRKKGSTRCDRIPIELIDEIRINSVNDYRKLIPQELSTEFTSKDYRKAAKTSLRTAQTALNILAHIGVVKRVGKQGNAHVYARA